MIRVYKCRMCGQVFTNGNITCLATCTDPYEVIYMKYRDSKHDIVSHEHSDGTYGVADLIGFNPGE